MLLTSNLLQKFAVRSRGYSQAVFVRQRVPLFRKHWRYAEVGEMIQLLCSSNIMAQFKGTHIWRQYHPHDYNPVFCLGPALFQLPPQLTGHDEAFAPDAGNVELDHVIPE